MAKNARSCVNVGASPDGWTWVVNRADLIYRFNANTQNWDNIPGGLVQISALSEDDALGTSRGHDVYLWRNGQWNKTPGVGSWMSIGQNDERWAISTDDSIWRWNHQIGNWDRQPGGAITVDVHSPGGIVVVNRANQVYAWLPEQKNWKWLEGKVAKRATIGDGVLITLGLDGLLKAVNF